MYKLKCEKCKEDFFSIRRNRRFCSHNCYHESKKLDKNSYNFNCNKCKKEYTLLLSENDFKKSKYKKFCSRKCANSRIMTDEIKEKISKSNNGKIYLHRRKEKIEKIKEEKIKNIKICVECGNEFEHKRNDKLCCSKECLNKRRIIAGSKGGRCNKQCKRSKNEIYFAQLCEKEFDNVLFNENIFNGWDADVILQNYKLAILWNGNWHYKKITKNHSLKQVQNRDNIKIKEILKCGYEPYIIVDKGKFNEKFVKSEFEKLIIFIKQNGLLV